MANSVYPDQKAPAGAVWAESALFAYAILWGTLAYVILECLPYIVGIIVWMWYISGNIDQAQYCDKIKGIVDFLGTDLSSDELTMIWKMQVGRDGARSLTYRSRWDDKYANLG